MPPEQVILTLLGTVVILFGCWYVTRLIANKASGQARVGYKNRNICLLDRYAIARDKQFCIIEIAGKVYVIGITNHTMTLLDTLDAAAFAQFTENNEDTAIPWNMTPVGQYGNKLTRKLVAFVAEKTGKTGNAKKKDDKSEDADFADSLRVAQDKAESAENDLNTTQRHTEKTQDETASDNQPESPEEDDADRR